MTIKKDEKISLLLVEDDIDFRKSLSGRLARNNYNVTAVESAEQALVEINSEKFQVIVSDIMLTGMDGLEFLSRIKKLDEDLPVILLTGYANLETAKKAVELNAYSYLIKPLDNISDLLTPLTNAIQNYKLKKEHILLKEHFENIVTNVPDGILTLNTSFEIESANKAFLKMFGLDEPEIINKHVEEIFDDKVTRNMEVVMKSIGLENNSVRFEWMTRSKGEEEFWADITLRRAIIGKKDSILMVVSDISAMKQAEEARKKIEIQFIQMQKQESLGSLTHGIAHEFNNILSIILGHAQLSMVEKVPEDVMQSLIEIEKASIRGSSLVENMTSFATPNLPEAKQQDIREVIDSAVGMQYRQLKLQNIEVEKDYTNEFRAFFDQGQIEQVFTNLLINAMHAIKPKGKGTIHISVKDADECLQIDFSDTGTGIDEEIREKIFDPFFSTKGAYAKDRYNITGSGLGLSVTKGIIQQHAGTISVSSEKGKGTTFTIRFPAARQMEINNTEQMNVSEDIDLDRIRNLRILLIDDEEEIVRLLTLVFDKAGFKNILIEDNGKKAISSFSRFNPDVVFLDMVMPDMDGQQVFNELKKINRNTPVVFMSGKTSLHKDEVLKQGSYDYIKKPFNINDLYRILDRIIRNGKMHLYKD
ncbi:MAG: response regulator [Spirochaetes bacterium]|nr:response regulator [Spirochaetota bacterium]